MDEGTSNGEFAPEVVLLYCQHCVAEDADPATISKATIGFKTRAVMMPCSSKVEVTHLLKLLEQGADGVQVVGCPDGRCRFLVGSVRAEKRIEYARHLLDETGIGADRLGMDRGDGMSAEELMAVVERRASTVRPLGSNPMKGRNGQ